MRVVRARSPHGAVGHKWWLGEKAGLLVVVVCIATSAAVVVWKNRLERTEIKIASMGTVDATATLKDAIRKGYFAEEGLEVDEGDITYVDSGLEGVKAIETGQVDIGYSTYVPFLKAVGDESNNVRLIAGASTAGPGSCVVVAMPDSGIKEPADLTGKTIAVTGYETISDSLTRYSLKEHGVDPRDVRWVTKSFDEMLIALNDHSIDAAFLTDPYLSMAQYRLDAVSVLDTATGAMANIPTAGFAARETFMLQNRETVRAFRRAIGNSIKDSLREPGQLAEIVEESAKVPRLAALSATLLTLDYRIDRRQLQRVADLMISTGVSKAAFDVERLLIDWPSLPLTDNGLQSGLVPSVSAFSAGRTYPMKPRNFSRRRRSSVRVLR